MGLRNHGAGGEVAPAERRRSRRPCVHAEVATLSTILILPIGIAVAFGQAQFEPGKGAPETLFSWPLILPPTAVGLLLLELLSRASGCEGRNRELEG